MTATADRSLYRPSTVVLTGKAMLGWLRRLLPTGMYSTVYRRIDRTYRSAIRLGYARFLARESLRHSPEGLARARAVYDAMPNSLVGYRGLEATYDAVTLLNHEAVPGALVECGVAQGGCAALMASTDARLGSRRLVYLCDSYEGLPDPTADDFIDGATGTHASILERGDCLGTLEQVSSLLFDRYRLDRTRVRLVKGWFQATLPSLAREIGGIALLRIDADWYESVKCCLDSLFANVTAGGVIIIDDYGSCHGARRALDEFLAAQGLHVQLTHDGRGGCSFRKPR